MAHFWGNPRSVKKLLECSQIWHGGTLTYIIGEIFLLSELKKGSLKGP